MTLRSYMRIFDSDTGALVLATPAPHASEGGASHSSAAAVGAGAGAGAAALSVSAPGGPDLEMHARG